MVATSALRRLRTKKSLEELYTLFHSDSYALAFVSNIGNVSTPHSLFRSPTLLGLLFPVFGGLSVACRFVCVSPHSPRPSSVLFVFWKGFLLSKTDLDRVLDGRFDFSKIFLNFLFRLTVGVFLPSKFLFSTLFLNVNVRSTHKES